MPDKEVEDRVHNFFAREDLSSSQHHSQAADGSWPGLGNNLWDGSQMHIGLPSSDSKGYSVQQSDIQRGQNNHSFQLAHGFNYGQPTPSPELAMLSQSQSPYSNGYMHGRQTLQTRQNETNNFGVDTESDQYTMTSRGLSLYESQRGDRFENKVDSARPQSSDSRSAVGFLDGQQLMSGQKMGMIQSLPQHLPGYNDMQPLQQQAMVRKMQELQRQHNTMQRNSMNLNPSIINGTPISSSTAGANNTWPSEPVVGNKSWLQRATQASQGTSNEFRTPQEQGQTLSLMGLMPQQVDQSQYSDPVSYTRDNPRNYAHVSMDKHPMQQMALYGNFSPGGQYTGPTNQVNGQDGSSSHGFRERNFLGQPSGQDPPGSVYPGNPQLVNSLQTGGPVHGIAGPSKTGEAKAVLAVTPSQNAVALDPTEEKILFGDDNIWDAFGDSVDTGTGGGCWSALMQSAVAESPRNVSGLQEEWSRPSIQNTEAAVDPFSGNNINKNFQGSPGFQQSVPNYPSEHGDRRQMDSTHRTYPSSEEGSKWLSRGPLQKPPAGEAQMHQYATHSSNAVVNATSMLGSSSPQQNFPLHNSDQLYGRPNGREDVDTPSSSRKEQSRLYANESKQQPSGSTDQRRMTHGEMNQGGHMWKMVPGSHSVGLNQARIGLGSSQVNRDDAKFDNHSLIPNSNIPRASEVRHPNANNLGFWNRAESSKMSKGNEHHLNKGSLVLESSMNTAGNDQVNMHGRQNSGWRENSSDSHQSVISQHTPARGSNDKSDTRNLLGGKQTIPGQGGHEVSDPHKFQNHLMRNVDEDVESSLGRKYATNDPTHGYLGHSKIGQFPNTSNEIKGDMFSAQQNKKGVDGSPSRGTLAGFTPNTSAPFDRDFSRHASDKVAQSSQNVVEFLQDMDQSMENSNSDGSVGIFKQSQSPSSRGFGLQLGFSSQSSAQNYVMPPHNATQLAGSISSSHNTPDMREKGNTSLTSTAQEECFPSFGGTSEGVKRNEISGIGASSHHASPHNMLGKLNSASNSGFPFLRSQLQGQQIFGAVDSHDPHSLQTRISQKDKPLSSGGTSQHTDALASRERVAAQEILMGRAASAWTKPPSQQHLMVGQPHNKFFPSISSASPLMNNMVSNPFPHQAGASGEGQIAKGSFHQLVPSTDLAPKPSVSGGKESVLKNQSDASPSNSASTERQFEAFGRTLKPNNVSHQTYSLLNQMRAMKSTEIDPSNRDSKRFKGADSSVVSQTRQGQLSEQRVTVGDLESSSYAASAGSKDKDSSSQHANALSRDVLVPDRMNSGNHPSSTSTSVRVENSQFSPQMAHAWFSQYGTSRNGQMLSMNDAHKHSNIKTIEQRFPLGKSSDTLRANDMMVQANTAAISYQPGNIWQSSSTSGKVENVPSSHLIAHDVAGKGLVVARKKKRKNVAKLPWHKEVTEGSQSLPTTSTAEVEWAEEANRLIDKVEDESKTFEDGPPSIKSKRRLIFTTHLMQQLFPPPEAAILSADAYSNHEAVACMGARLALGDACRLIPCSKSDSSPLVSINPLTDKHQKTTSARINDQHLSEVTKNFIGRADKLETDFMSFEKKASVVDVRVECQELEKVSMINRFATFHGRGQADVAPPRPQRYVNALPMPNILPEGVQCLSL